MQDHFNGLMSLFITRSIPDLTPSDSTLMNCCTGIGSHLAQAIQNGMEAWMRSDGFLIFSLLNSQPVQGAEWFPHSDPFGVPGWALFSSPYIIRGVSTGAEFLHSFLQEHPLLEPIRQDIPQFLNKKYPLHIVSIYRGISMDEHFTACHINDAAIQCLSEKLLTSDWLLEGIEWASVRQSRLLLGPPQ